VRQIVCRDAAMMPLRRLIHTLPAAEIKALSEAGTLDAECVRRLCRRRRRRPDAQHAG
jgi:hypothetical protein